MTSQTTSLEVSRPSEREEKVLRVMYDILSNREDGSATFFKYIAPKTKLTISQVRRAVRALSRKGFTEYVKGLIDDDGMIAGSGYSLTEEGYAFVSHCDLCERRNTYEYEVDENGNTTWEIGSLPSVRTVKECEQHYKQSAQRPQQQSLLTHRLIPSALASNK